MENFDKYREIPYLFNGETTEGADCAGLAKMFYIDHGWTDVCDYPKPQEKQWYVHDRYYMERYLLKHFDKTRDIDALEFGDLAVVRINGETHLFIYLGYDRVLTTYPKLDKWNGGCSFIDRLKKYWLTRNGVEFVAGFKRRKQTKDGGDK